MRSRVDNETESRIQKLIQTRLRGKTVIAVNHRLEAVLDYDRVVVLHNGQVEDVGTPSELMGRCDLFAGMTLV